MPESSSRNKKKTEKVKAEKTPKKPRTSSRVWVAPLMLACWLLGGDKLQVELPVNYAAMTPALKGILDPYWNHVALEGALHGGGAFFFRIR